MLSRFASGFGTLGLAQLLGSEAAGSPAHFAAKAKRVIFLSMSGGPSHVDLFDPKPKLTAMDGQPLPFEKPKLERAKTGNLFGSPFRFGRHGQSGTEVSELLPHLSGCVDDLCVIRSMVADNINHIRDAKGRELWHKTITTMLIRQPLKLAFTDRASK
jgi:sarcosine oxidase delta subunit